MVEKTALIPEGSTKPIGKYLPGIAAPMNADTQLVFVSGQVSSDDNGQIVALGDAECQTEFVFDKIAAVLAAAGGDLSHLVSLVIYLTDMDNFDAVSSVRNRVLPNPAPSSTLVEVSALAIKEHLVEISGIAIVPKSRNNDG